MALSLAAVFDSLRVYPSSIAAAAAPVHAIGVAVFDCAKALPSGVGVVAAIGQPACADNLESTLRLVVQAITASSDGLDKLSQALAEAATTYRFTDASSLDGWSW